MSLSERKAKARELYEHAAFWSGKAQQLQAVRVSPTGDRKFHGHLIREWVALAQSCQDDADRLVTQIITDVSH